MVPPDKNSLSAMQAFKADWNLFARDVLGVTLDSDQQDILRSVQNNRRTTVRSGHARGKDYTAAVAALCFLYLNGPCKVIHTAPTGRQVVDIIMAEIRHIHGNAKMKLGGIAKTQKIDFPGFPNYYLEGFKAEDKDAQAWTGYHSPHILMIVSEASGIKEETYEAIEGILTGEIVRFLLVGNHTRVTGTFNNSFSNAWYEKFTLNCLNAPNVVAKQAIYPGQVDYLWVKEHVENRTWATPINKAEANLTAQSGDFEFEDKFYRALDQCRTKILGLPPLASEDSLIPLEWIDAANERWLKWEAEGKPDWKSILRIGADIAGDGVDKTCFANREKMTILEFEYFPKSNTMVAAGLLKTRIKAHDKKGLEVTAAIDSIGEGSGTYERLYEQGLPVYSGKFSLSAQGFTDVTGQREFINMRAYCYWAVRDNLDPNQNGVLAFAPNDDLKQELLATKWTTKSNGKIAIISKDEIKKALGRSPDDSDALALTFWPTIARNRTVVFDSLQEFGDIEGWGG